MTTFGHKIAAARDDNTVGIYDSVTGVLKLSLSPGSPIQAITGSPNGYTLCCLHKTPSITVWDIQTGGLIHTFVLERNPEHITVSLKGRYLARGFSDESMEVWDVTNNIEVTAVWASSPVTCFCWLKPEEQLAVSTGRLVRVWDIVAGTLLHSFAMGYPVHHMIYVQKSNQLVIVAGSEPGNFSVEITNPWTGAISIPHRFPRQPSCLAFSQATKELVCEEEARGLHVLNVSTQRWRHISYPDTVTSIFPLPNWTVAVNTVESGIQLLSLDVEPAGSLDPAISISVLTIHPLDRGKVITILPTSRNFITLVEVATMKQLLTIPVPRNSPTPTNHTRIFCASLVNSVAVYSFNKRGQEYIQMWEFHDNNPKWTVEIDGPSSIGRIAPSGTRLVTFCDVDNQTRVCVWNVESGRLEAQLRVDTIHPLDIAFDTPERSPYVTLGYPRRLRDKNKVDSEKRFYSHHDTHRVPYDIILLDQRVPVTPSSDFPTLRYRIVRHEPLPLIGGPRWRYDVDDTYEWVVSDSKRIGWIPPGYIRSVQPNYCWAGSSLVMIGKDGTLTRLTFENYSEGDSEG
jgi:WD40 repeat protein